jgi:hypothetical protein
MSTEQNKVVVRRFIHEALIGRIYALGGMFRIYDRQ